MFMFLFMVSSAIASDHFEATAYVNSCEGCTGLTYWRGLVANPWGPIKIMAVDPKVLTLGKCYTIRFSDGHESVYLAADIGGAIKGKKVDLLLKSVESARKFGRQKVQVVSETTCPVDPLTLPRS